MSDVITTLEASLLAKVTRNTIAKNLRKGNLKGFREKRRNKTIWYVYKDSVEELYYKVDAGQKQHNTVNREKKSKLENIESNSKISTTKKNIYTNLYNEFGNIKWANADIDEIRKYLYSMIV